MTTLPVKITASDVAAATGLSKNAIPRSLWEVKTGSVLRDHDQTEATEHGKKSEPLVIAAFCEITGQKLAATDGGYPGWFYSVRRVVRGGIEIEIGAAPDAMVVDGKAGIEHPVEIKSPLHREFDHVPPDVMAQVQMQLEVLDKPFGDVCAFFRRRGELVIWRVYRSKIFWAWMEERLATFAKCVQDGTPPENIPNVFVGANVLAESGFDFTRLSTEEQRKPRKTFPPKVHTVLTHRTPWSPGDSLVGRHQPSFISRMRGSLTSGKMILLLLVICLSLIMASVVSHSS